MPWCPQCKNEYKEGVTVCADCGCELVESLEDQEKPVYFGTEEEILKMISFLEANQFLDVACQYDEAEQTYELVVKEKDRERARKMLRVYLREIAAEQGDQEEEKKPDIKESLYEESGKRAEEYRTGAMTLLVVGGIGLVVLVLLYTGIIPLNIPVFTKNLTSGVMGVLFVIFIVLGISSLKTYHNLKNRAQTENSQKEELISWIQENITPDSIDENIMQPTEAESTKEELYFKRTDWLKTILREQSPESTDAFLDYIIEEVYETLFAESQTD